MYIIYAQFGFTRAGSRNIILGMSATSSLFITIIGTDIF